MTGLLVAQPLGCPVPRPLGLVSSSKISSYQKPKGFITEQPEGCATDYHLLGKINSNF